LKKKVTKGDINRLGDKIRKEYGNFSSDTLDELQAYRTSHKESLSQVFQILLNLRKKVRRDSIVTYRIKRFESIIEKIVFREKGMKFSRMGDIAGCRIIVQNNREAYAFEHKIRQVLNVKNAENDYIKRPKKNGYKSLHLYVTLPDNDKTIEIQIRNQVDHNWATLVEITDLLFDSQLKEYGKDKKLERLHYLLSKDKDELDYYEVKEVAKIVKDYRYLDKLNSIFSRNYLEVRKNWLEIEKKHRYRFFLIESSVNEIPKIEAYDNFDEAESKYYDKFKENNDANVVLTHLHKPNYKQISIAYSNYILTMHSFVDEFSKLFEKLIIHSLQIDRHYDFLKFFDLYYNNLTNRFINEIKEASYSNNTTDSIPNSKSRKESKKEKEWRVEINKNFKDSERKVNKFRRQLNANMPKGKFKKWRTKRTLKRISKKYEKKIKKELNGIIDL